MNKTKYDFYSYFHLIDFIIVSIVLITIAQEAILDGAYISAIIITLSVIFLLGKIHYLMEDLPKENIFCVYKSHSFPIKLFGNYIQCLSLVPVDTIKEDSSEYSFAITPVLSICKTKFIAGDCIYCKFIDNSNKGSFIKFYKRAADS